MNTECANCPRHAVAYWGPVAYCKECLARAKRNLRNLHRCTRCDEQQPPNVSWHRNAVCGKCQAKERT